MKILGIAGSPKKSGSTSLQALSHALEQCRELGAETETIVLSDYTFGGCHDCDYCKNKLGCSQKDDFTAHILPKLAEKGIDAIIYASPVYFGGVTAQMKAFIDRSVPLRRNGFLLADKIAGALTIGRSRNGGQELAAMDIVKSCLIHGMTVVPDGAPTSHFGGNLWSGHPEGTSGDDIGMATAANLGKRIAQMAIKLRQ
jgi:multimeric flavodoxin WrbA